MKVPPKRKGNGGPFTGKRFCWFPLNESPSEKEGKFILTYHQAAIFQPSMKVPPKRKGNPFPSGVLGGITDPQ